MNAKRTPKRQALPEFIVVETPFDALTNALNTPPIDYVVVDVIPHSSDGRTHLSYLVLFRRMRKTR